MKNNIHHIESPYFYYQPILKMELNKIFIFIMSSESFPPIIRGETTFVVTVGQMSVYQFSVEHASTGSIVGVVGGIPSGATLMRYQESYQFSFLWNTSFQNFSLQFYVNNAMNETTLHIVQIQLCNCQNGGKCISNGLVGSDINTTVILNCKCNRGIGRSLWYYLFNYYCISSSRSRRGGGAEIVFTINFNHTLHLSVLCMVKIICDYDTSPPPPPTLWIRC